MNTVPNADRWDVSFAPPASYSPPPEPKINADLWVEDGMAPTAHVINPHTSTVRMGPLTLYGSLDVLESTLATALSAVRAKRAAAVDGLAS